MSHGSVRPWPSSVSTMTVRVTTSSASRVGKRRAAGRVSGSASATASETTPRMPAQDRTSACASEAGRAGSPAH